MGYLGGLAEKTVLLIIFDSGFLPARMIKTVIVKLVSLSGEKMVYSSGDDGLDEF